MDSLLPDRATLARAIARPILDEEDRCDMGYDDVEPARFLQVADAALEVLPTRQQLIERIVALSDEGHIYLTQDEQGSWPGTAEHAEEVRSIAATIADGLLGVTR